MRPPTLFIALVSYIPLGVISRPTRKNFTFTATALLLHSITSNWHVKPPRNAVNWTTASKKNKMVKKVNQHVPPPNSNTSIVRFGNGREENCYPFYDHTELSINLNVRKESLVPSDWNSPTKNPEPESRTAVILDMKVKWTKTDKSNIYNFFSVTFWTEEMKIPQNSVW